MQFSHSFHNIGIPSPKPDRDMEKFSLFVKKVLALFLSGAVWYSLSTFAIIDRRFEDLLLAAFAFLLFGYLDFRITGTKPRFLFELNQSDTHLNKKGGFWNLFRWVVILPGLAYDLVVWSGWGVYLLFVLAADLLLLIRTVLYWIIYALAWFIRQLFPAFIFIFRMFMHYIVNWSWRIYQLAARNVRISLNRNFYFIALWGTIPAIFIVFLFFVISQIAGIPELVLLSYLFAIVPLTWSFGEIAILRYEGREKDAYSSVRDRFRNGFDGAWSVMFYLMLLFVLLVAEIALNLLGWIPGLSMSLLGISLNLNMAITLVLFFLVLILAYIPGILPTHILFHQEHQNDLRSSIVVLGMLGKKFLRYTFVEVPVLFFGSLLLVLPAALLVITFFLTDTVKDATLDARVQQLTARAATEPGADAIATRIRIDRLEIYKDVPLLAPELFVAQMDGSRIDAMEKRVADMMKKVDAMQKGEATAQEREIAYDETAANMEPPGATSGDRSNQGTLVKQEQEERLAIMQAELQEMKRQRAQMPVLYLFTGILVSVFGGLVLAVYVSYIGNVYYELYDLEEDGKPSFWSATLAEMKKKDPNQPLLGFTLLGILGILVFLALRFGWLNF